MPVCESGSLIIECLSEKTITFLRQMAEAGNAYEKTF
jgi:hypothetical protein